MIFELYDPAKFDIVDTITLDDMENLTLAEVLLNHFPGRIFNKP